jgi:hypothetical protein
MPLSETLVRGAMNVPPGPAVRCGNRNRRRVRHLPAGRERQRHVVERTLAANTEQTIIELPDPWRTEPA